MKILFLHGWNSVPGGVKPTFLKNSGHKVINPALDDDDFDIALKTAQEALDSHLPDIVVGSSRGGAVAMNLSLRGKPMVLLCPAWKNWGSVNRVPPNTTILHSREDDVIPFADSLELVSSSLLSENKLVEVGTDHRLADPEPLEAMLGACESEYFLSLLFSLYEGLKRKGPGSAESTQRALSLCGEIPADPVVADFGCGSGVATIELAKTIRGTVTAIDIHQAYLDELGLEARQLDIDFIETVLGDMNYPPFETDSLDLIWAEGSIYNLGVEKGLSTWKPFLRPKGRLAFTEVSWFTEARPKQIEEFWAEAYPAIATVEENLAKIESTGFRVIGHFALPKADWESFYAPLSAQLEKFEISQQGNPIAAQIVEMHHKEVSIWNQFSDFYGYEFYICESPAS